MRAVWARVCLCSGLRCSACVQRKWVVAASDIAASSVALATPVTSAMKRGALRAKCRTQDQPQAGIPGLVAQHPENRNGMAINGQRTDELLRQVIGHFDNEEA